MILPLIIVAALTAPQTPEQFAVYVAAGHAVTRPDWLRKPTGADMAKAYPKDLAKRGQGGVATLQCIVTVEGTLAECHVQDERPTGRGIGEAALKVTRAFQMKPLEVDGTPVGGGIVRIPIVFRIEGPRVDMDWAVACYGLVAQAAEKDPRNTAAWKAADFWVLQLIAGSISSYSYPSVIERIEHDSLAAAEKGDLRIPKGADLGRCISIAGA